MEKNIDVVIIGLNSARTLGDCIRSVGDSHYPQKNLTTIYVDGGSTDDSVSIASSLGAKVFVLNTDRPSPGKQRNHGWQSGTGELVQFLDSDTVMDPDWLIKAVEALAPDVGAVSGDLKERYPEKSKYNWIGDQEWNPPAGDIPAFGGIVLVRRSVLQETSGYDLELIGGEDPELAYRVRKAGHRIVKINQKMATHDLAMFHFAQYWKRSRRSGHAYAEVHHRHPDFWADETRRIVVKGFALVVGVLCLPAMVLSPWLGLVTLGAVIFLLRPRLLLVRRFQKAMSLTKSEAAFYSWHASFVVIPQFFGVLRYWFGRIFSKPLTNKRLLKK